MKRNYEIQPFQTFEEQYKEEHPDLPLPVELSLDDLKVFNVTLQGNDFLAIPAIICPKCGHFTGIKKVTLPDKSQKWYLIFGCEDYKKVDPTNTSAPVVPAPDGGSGSSDETPAA